MSTTNESIWNDIRRRGIGTDIKQEDDVNLLDVDGLYEYVKKHYTGKVFYIDKDNFGSKHEKVCVDPVKNVSLYTKYDNNNGELDHILISWISVHLDKDFIWKIYDRFQVEKTNPYRLCVWNQDGTCTNQTYIDLIDLFVENKDNVVVNESVWNDIRRRGIGTDIKEEEITEDFLNSVKRCFVGFSMRIVYHLTEKEYEPILDDFCKYLEVDEKDEDPDTIKKIIAYVNSHQDECEKMLDKCMTFEKKLLEEKVICYIHRFVDDIVYCEKYHNTLSDIKRYASERFRNDNSCEHFFPTKNMISKKKSELFDNYIEDNWPTGYLKKKIDELIKKENDEMLKYGFKKEPGKTIADTVNDWWDSLDGSKRDELAWDEFGEDAEEEYYTNHNPKYNDYDGEGFYADEWWDDSYYIRRVHIYCQEHSKKNESVWNDIRRRGNGEEVKKEDEVLTDMEINSLNEFTLMYCRKERAHYIQHHIVPPPPSRRKENDYEGLIKYIEDRRDENLFTNVGDYDKIIKYIKKNWDRLDMDTYIKKWICSPSVMKGTKIVECDGVPGGATPANVGGMGAAYFPGPNGEPGSGDLPSPTGVVYHQIAPFGIFIKELKKKKKKKKFRKEDEPCSHSPNAKVYDYVDDYREYVDRTYTMMNKKK